MEKDGNRERRREKSRRIKRGEGQKAREGSSNKEKGDRKVKEKVMRNLLKQLQIVVDIDWSPVVQHGPSRFGLPLP